MRAEGFSEASTSWRDLDPDTIKMLDPDPDFNESGSAPMRKTMPNFLWQKVFIIRFRIKSSILP